MKDLYYNDQNQFITLADLSVGNIPNNIEFRGKKFIVKSEFHITLLALEQIAEIIDKDNIEKLKPEIVQDFYEFVERFPLIEYQSLDDIRLVTVAGNQTIIIMVKFHGIERLFEVIGEKYQKTLPMQPTHITLYTLPSDTFGIPILSYEELHKISETIDMPELNELI